MSLLYQTSKKTATYHIKTLQETSEVFSASLITTPFPDEQLFQPSQCPLALDW